MFEKLRRELSKGHRSEILAGAAAIALGTLAVRGLAFLKDIFVARGIGLSADLDAFLLALGLIDLLLSIIVGAMHYSFIPVLVKVKTEGRSDEAQRLLSSLVSLSILAMSVLAAILAVLMPSIVGIMTSTPEVQARLGDLLRSLLPLLVILSFGALLQGVLNAGKHFFLSAVVRSGIPFVTLILLVAAGTDHATIYLLVYGALIGASLEALILIRAVGKTGLRAVPGIPQWTPELRSVLAQCAALSAGSVFTAGGIFVDRYFAAQLVPGTVSWLNYANKIPSVIISLAAVAVSGAMLPILSERWIQNDVASCRKLVRNATILLFCLPLGALLPLMIWSEDLVSLLFERGKFTTYDSLDVGGLQRFALVTVPIILAGIPANRLIVAMGESKFLAKCTAAGFFATVVLDYVFTVGMGSQIGGVGIIFAAIIVQAGLSLSFYWFVRRRLNQPEHHEKSSHPIPVSEAKEEVS